MSKIRSMSKIRYEFEDGEIQLIDIPQDLINKIKKDSYNQAFEDFANAFIKKINEKMNIEYFYGDDYYSGLEHGYSYSIEIADELLKEKLKK